MSKKILIPGLIIIGILIGLAAGSHIFRNLRSNHFKGPGGSSGKYDFMLGRMFKELKFTDKQKKKVNELQDEIHEKIKAAMEDNKKEDMRKEIIEQIKKDNIDKTQIMNIITDKEKQKKDMGNFMIGKLIEFHTILTPQQREELAKRIEKFGDHEDKKYKGKKGKKKKYGHGGRKKRH